MRVRIFCRMPRPEPGGLIVGYAPELQDVYVYVIDGDGTEKHLEGVQSVSFSANAEGVTARLEILDVEIDAESDVDTCEPMASNPRRCETHMLPIYPAPVSKCERGLR